MLNKTFREKLNSGERKGVFARYNGKFTIMEYKEIFLSYPPFFLALVQKLRPLFVSVMMNDIVH